MGTTARTTAANARSRLIEMARHNLGVVESGTLEQAPDVMRIPAEVYYDQNRWQREMDRVFRRMPLMLAMSCELRNTGDFKTLDVCGVPVLIVRTASGDVRARDGAGRRYAYRTGYR